MTILPNYYTRKEAAAFLNISPQRISVIAKADNWERYRIGRSWLYAADDVRRTHKRHQAQKAWAIIGIPRNLWGEWWLRDMDEIEMFECPECGDTAYSPFGAGGWSEKAACPECKWNGNVPE